MDSDRERATATADIVAACYHRLQKKKSKGQRLDDEGNKGCWGEE